MLTHLDACRYIPPDKPSRPTPTYRSILGIQLKVALFCQTLADPKKKNHDPYNHEMFVPNLLPFAGT
jgi:hypothetical protein